jgi:hypothetical protein
MNIKFSSQDILNKYICNNVVNNVINTVIKVEFNMFT